MLFGSTQASITSLPSNPSSLFCFMLSCNNYRIIVWELFDFPHRYFSDINQCNNYFLLVIFKLVYSSSARSHKLWFQAAATFLELIVQIIILRFSVFQLSFCCTLQSVGLQQFQLFVNVQVQLLLHLLFSCINSCLVSRYQLSATVFVFCHPDFGIWSLIAICSYLRSYTTAIINVYIFYCQLQDIYNYISNLYYEHYFLSSGHIELRLLCEHTYNRVQVVAFFTNLSARILDSQWQICSCLPASSGTWKIVLGLTAVNTNRNLQNL